MDFDSLSLPSKILQYLLWIATYWFLGAVYWAGYFSRRVTGSGDTKFHLLPQENRGVLPQVWFFPIFTIEIVSIWRWFTAEHMAFWEGLKELIWAITPLVNITYSWEWIWGGQFPIRLLFSLIFEFWFIVLAIIWSLIFYKLFGFLNDSMYEKIQLKYSLARNPVISFFVGLLVIVVVFFMPVVFIFWLGINFF